MKRMMKGRLFWTVLAWVLAIYLNTSLAEAAENKKKAAVNTSEIEATEEVDPALSLPMQRPNTISLELLGRGGLYSLNYDRTLSDKVAVGAGISRYNISAGGASAGAWMLPFYANYYFGKSNHRAFVSAGPTLILASGDMGDGSGLVTGSGLAGTLGGGYEYRADNGFLFRAAPYVFVGNAKGVWIGLSAGYSI